LLLRSAPIPPLLLIVMAVMKRPEVEEKEEEEVTEKQREKLEKQKAANEKAELARREEELTAARRKELKAMQAADLKALVDANGLEASKIAERVSVVLKFEAKARSEERARQADIRKMLIQKKEELEAMTMPQLREASPDVVKGQVTKEARIQATLQHWQQEGGVEKALAKLASDTRQKDLEAMDTAELRKLCKKISVDPFVKEVMVARIVFCESERGLFARPKLDDDEVEAEAAPKTGDMVEQLLASEANRKREREERKQAEEAMAKMREEFKSASIEQLKKKISSKGREPTGKKDDLVETLMDIAAEEKALAARRDKLRNMEADDLKNLLHRKGLAAPGKKDAMADAVLAYEAKVRADAVAYAVKIEEVLAEKKVEFEAKTAAELKDRCISLNIVKLGVGKESYIERLLEHTRMSSDVDKILVVKAREARRLALLSMDTEALLKLCDAMGVNPSVKEVIIERIMWREEESGGERPSKKARKAEYAGA